MTAKPYSPEELAERWNVSGKCVRQMCARGDLAYFKIGKLYRIPAAVVDERERVQVWNTDSRFTGEPGQSSGESMDEQSAAAQERPTRKPPRERLRILKGPGNQAIVTR